MRRTLVLVVLVVLALSAAPARGAADPPQPPPGPRFAAGPILLNASAPPRDIAVFRLTEPLPARYDGAVTGRAVVGGRPATLGTLGGNCYSAETRGLRAGHVYTIMVLPGEGVAPLSARVVLRRGRAAEIRGASLGCPSS